MRDDGRRAAGRVGLALMRVLSLVVLAGLGTVALMRWAPGYFADSREMDAPYADAGRRAVEAQRAEDGSVAASDGACLARSGEGRLRAFAAVRCAGGGAAAGARGGDGKAAGGKRRAGVGDFICACAGVERAAREQGRGGDCSPFGCAACCACGCAGYALSWWGILAVRCWCLQAWWLCGTSSWLTG